MKHAVLPEPALTTDQRQRLAIFMTLLEQWNASINLVSRSDLGALWPRHIADSLQLAALLPPWPDQLVDLGSGAGFPGLILAIATEWRVHLVESDQRKATFLREAVRLTGATAAVHAQRAETLSLPGVAIVTARALAPLPVLLGLAQPLLAADGKCLFPKGRSAEHELTDAAIEWHMRVERFASRTSPDATILRISEINRAGPTP